jgi:hypothetical protein
MRLAQADEVVAAVVGRPDRHVDAVAQIGERGLGVALVELRRVDTDEDHRPAVLLEDERRRSGEPVAEVAVDLLDERRPRRQRRDLVDGVGRRVGHVRVAGRGRPGDGALEERCLQPRTALGAEHGLEGASCTARVGEPWR